MRKTVFICAALVASVVTSGCLHQDSTHVLYLSPDGGVRWVATEVNVYSDEKDPGLRLAEEQAYIGPALIGAHPVAAGLEALAPDSLIDTQVIRDERPFHVITQARFTSIDRLVQRMLRELGVAGSARLTSEDDRISLHVAIDFSREMKETRSAFSQLALDVDEFRLVLAEGRFADSPGFDVVDGINATLSAAWMEHAQEAYGRSQPVELKLSWRLTERWRP